MLVLNTFMECSTIAKACQNSNLLPGSCLKTKRLQCLSWLDYRVAVQKLRSSYTVCTCAKFTRKQTLLQIDLRLGVTIFLLQLQYLIVLQQGWLLSFYYSFSSGILSLCNWAWNPHHLYNYSSRSIANIFSIKKEMQT